MTVRSLIDKAIDFCGGSRRKLETRMGVPRNTLYRALETAQESALAEKHADLAVRIEDATQGAVPAYELIPSLPWPHAPKEPAAEALTHDTGSCREGC